MMLKVIFFSNFIRIRLIISITCDITSITTFSFQYSNTSVFNISNTFKIYFSRLIVIIIGKLIEAVSMYNCADERYESFRHIFLPRLVGFLGDQKRRGRLETRGLCCVLLPFFPRTSHRPSNETTKGTGTKNNARNPPKYALYTGCFISVANWSECSRSNYGRIYKVESCRIPRYHCDPLYGKNCREREVHHRVQPRIYCYSAASLAIRGKDSMI